MPDQPVPLPTPLPAPAAPPPPTPPAGREDHLKELAQIRAVLSGLGTILAPRALLFVAMVGAIGLTVTALFVADWQHLLAAVSFDVLVFWPTAFLYWKG